MVLVTGATGLVGSYLLHYLTKKGIGLIAIKRQNSNVKAVKAVFKILKSIENFKNIQWVNADVNDVNSLQPIFEKVEQVYHCAAMVSFDKKDKARMHEINVEGTKNIVNLCLQYKIKKMCFVSSIASTGKPNFGKYITEESYYNDQETTTDYSVTKYLSEQEVWKGIENGLNTVIVNPAIILGAGIWTGTGKLFETIYKGLRFYTTGTNAFVDVRDVAQIMIQLMDKNIFGQRYILASCNLSFKELMQSIAKAMNKPIPKFKVSFVLGEMVWRVAKVVNVITGKQISITKETIRSGRKKSYYSNDKIKKELNYSFIPIHKTIKQIGLIYNECQK